jgi:hypothetical protein
LGPFVELKRLALDERAIAPINRSRDPVHSASLHVNHIGVTLLAF